jgi:hypothetical protein
MPFVAGDTAWIFFSNFNRLFSTVIDERIDCARRARERERERGRKRPMENKTVESLARARQRVVSACVREHDDDRSRELPAPCLSMSRTGAASNERAVDLFGLVRFVVSFRSNEFATLDTSII